MNGSTIKEFLVGLGFEIDDVSLGKFGEGIAKATVLTGALAAGVAAAGAAVFGFVKGIAQEFTDLDVLATRLNTTADKLDDLKDIGQIVGVKDGVVEDSLKALNRAMGDTANGMGRAKEIFKDLGIQVTDANGKLRSSTDVLDDLQAKFKGMDKGRALALMDRLGLDPSLAKIFSADLDGIRAELEAIDKAANFDFADTVKRSRKLTDAWKAWNREVETTRIVLSTLRESIASRFMPRITAAIDMLRVRLATARKWIIENITPVMAAVEKVIGFILDLLGGFLQFFGRIAGLVGATITGVIRWWQTLGDESQTLVVRLGLVAAAVWAVNRALLASPVTWVLALGAALVGLIDDYAVWKEGGDSLIDWSDWQPGIDATIEGITAFRDWLRELFVDLYDVIASGVDVVSGVFRTLFALVDVFSTKSDGSVDAATRRWTAFGEVVQGVADIFSGLFGIVTKVVDIVGRWLGMGPSISAEAGAAASALATQAGGAVRAVLAPRPFPGAEPAPAGPPAASRGLPGAPGMPAAPQGTTAEAASAPMAPLGVPSVTNNTTGPTTVNATINVTGSGNPEATARAAVGEMNRTAADITRNTKGATR